MSDGYDFAVGAGGGSLLVGYGGYQPGVEGGVYAEGVLGPGEIRFQLGFGSVEVTESGLGEDREGEAVDGERTFSIRQTRLSLLFSPRFLQSPRNPGQFHAALYGGADLRLGSASDRFDPAPSEGSHTFPSQRWNQAGLGGIVAFEGRIPVSGERLLATFSAWYSLAFVLNDGGGPYSQAGALLGLRYEL